MKRGFTWWLWCGWALAASAVEPAISFRNTVELSSVGLKLNTFDDATAKSLPSPRVKSIGARDIFAFWDLWYRAQWMGQWSSAGGDVMMLGHATWLAGPDLMGSVTHAERFSALQASALPPATDAQLAEWIKAFTGMKPVGAPAMVSSTMRMREAKRFDLSRTGFSACAYAFRFRPNSFGVNPEDWYVLVVVSRRANPAELSASVERGGVLSSITLTAPPKPVARAGARPGAAGRPETVVSGAGHSALDVSRMTAQRSIEGKKGWWTTSSSNYVIVTSLKSSRRGFVDRTLQDMESLRRGLARMIPPIRPIDAASVIRIFEDGAEYLAYVGSGLEWSGGLWNPEKRELVIRPMDDNSVKQQREWTTKVLYHEGLHQYLFYAYGGAETPVWYNEGHATFMEGVEWKRMGMEITEPDRYVSAVEQMVRAGTVDFTPLLQMSYADFYTGESSVVQQRYALAWAMVYYLRKGVAAERDSPCAGVLDRMQDALRQGAPAAAATQAAFQGVDMGDFNRRFMSFWKSATLRSAARRLDLSAPAGSAPLSWSAARCSRRKNG